MISTHGNRPDAPGLVRTADSVRGSALVKRGMAHMLKGGVVMDVTSAEQARIAEEAGAVAVMVLDKLPSEVRRAGGVARTAGVGVIEEVKKAVTIPVMAKCRIGHWAEARVLEQSDVDMIDESEVLTPADPKAHIWKWDYTIPFVCGARSLGEALRRVEEGASMIRTKGEPGTGNVAEAITHVKAVNDLIRHARSLRDAGDMQGLALAARSMGAPLHLVEEVARSGRLPVVNFAAGGIATPADAAQMMSLGCDGIFVGSGIFDSSDPAARARAVVLATSSWRDHAAVRRAQGMVDERGSMGGIGGEPDLRMQEQGPQ